MEIIRIITILGFMEMVKNCFIPILQQTLLVILPSILTLKSHPLCMPLSFHPYTFIYQVTFFVFSFSFSFPLLVSISLLISSSTNHIIQADSILYNDYRNPSIPPSIPSPFPHSPYRPFQNPTNSVDPFIDPCTDLSLQQPLVVCRSVRRIREEMFIHNTVSLFIQMEYCGNGSLRDVLQSREEPPLSTRVNYFIQVWKGV